MNSQTIDHQVHVYVLDLEGNPMAPTTRCGKVKRLLKSNEAKVVRRKPFTIQLLYPTTTYHPFYTMGVDSGYQHIGISVIDDTKEVYRADVSLLEGQKERNEERKMYRRNRRSRKRHRAPRFDNRKKKEGWYAPSIQHKLDSHIRIIEQIESILPIGRKIIEVANFDTQKIMKPDVEGKEYQEGVQKDFYNLREYILHRDNHQCQNPNCKNKDKNPILELHHIQFRSNGGSNAPWNLITLCNKCHTPQNHKGFLKDWKPKINEMKGATFMSSIRWQLVDRLQCEHTYGYLTKSKRIEHGIEKSHDNDAFVMAGGTNAHARTELFNVQQTRRNNRSLRKFYDAKYIDFRTKEKVGGKNLTNGRTKRNKEKNSQNLHVYRQQKLSKGRWSKRTKRYFYQPNDLVYYDKKRYWVAGSQNEGAYIKLKGLKKVPKAETVTPLKYGKGFCYL